MLTQLIRRHQSRCRSPRPSCICVSISPDDDALITALIVTARQQAEHRTGRALVSQQWRQGLDQFPDDSLELPKPKLVSVQSVTYLDSNGTRRRWRVATTR